MFKCDHCGREVDARGNVTPLKQVICNECEKRWQDLQDVLENEEMMKAYFEEGGLDPEASWAEMKEEMDKDKMKSMAGN